MSLFAAQDSRPAGVGRKAGLFVAIAIALVVALGVAALIRHNVFTQTTRLYFFADTASGISKGMSVQLSGFKIGTVTEIELEPDARAKVALVVDSKYLRFITQDAEARLARENVLGVNVVRIVPGSREVRQAPSDGVLAFARADDFTEKIDPILADVRSITRSLNDPDGDMHQTFKNIREITANFAATQTQIDRLLAQTRGAIEQLQTVMGGADGAIKNAAQAAGQAAQAAGQAAQAAGQTAQQAHALLETINQGLPGIMLKLDATLANAVDASDKAKRLAKQLSDELPPAVEEGRGALRDTRDVVQGAKTAWPIRNWVAPRLERALPLDSHDNASQR